MYQPRFVTCEVNQYGFIHVIKTITVSHNIHEAATGTQLLRY